MTSGDDPFGGPRPPLRIGNPERQQAEDVLETHLAEQRLDSDEFDRRVAACQRATTQAELLQVFADLPAPHPRMPPSTDDGGDADDADFPPVAVAGCLALGLGLPVAVVLGFVYGAWWALAVPVAVTVLGAYVEHLRRPRDSGADADHRQRPERESP
ncbi:DUF1707 domain-containing protein [Micromonospora sp. NPDC000089]|uniref:DUF1707 SHOCT-like domain-containing protein n=1 Tax=unclassified Micromonospora TaxID=2617518 RepID=UPI0036B5EEBF